MRSNTNVRGKDGGTRRTATGLLAAIAALPIILAGCAYAMPELENPLDPAVSVSLDQITFGDPDFRDIVYANSDGSTNSVTRIEDNGNLVTSLEGIQYLSDLEELRLWGPSGISDLTPVGQLRRLRWIDLSQANISDLTPLSSVSTLEGVFFSSNPISSFDPLSNLPRLERFGFSGTFNGATGYSGTLEEVLNATGATRVFVDNFDLSDPASLAVFANRGLNEIQLSGCGLTAFPATTPFQVLDAMAAAWDSDLASLPVVAVSFPNLDYLRLDGLDNPAIDWFDLVNIQAPNLREIQAGDIPVSSWPSLASAFPNLEQAHLNNCAFTSLDMLIGLDNLEGISFERNPVTDFSALAQLDSVSQLWLRNTGFTDSDFIYLQGMNSLRRLEIPDNPGVGSLSAVAGMNLEYLHISNCTGIDTLYLGDIAGIFEVYAAEEGLPSITTLVAAVPPTVTEQLTLNGQLITDISPLASMSSLREIYAPDNNISTGVRELEALTNVDYINLSGNPIPQADIDYLREQLPNTTIDF